MFNASKPHKHMIKEKPQCVFTCEYFNTNMELEKDHEINKNISCLLAKCIKDEELLYYL